MGHASSVPIRRQVPSNLTDQMDTLDLPASDPYDLTGQVTLSNYMPEFRGNYSCVFRGTFEGKLVAVKVITATGENASVARKVRREIAVWGSLNHRNIHSFSGFTNDQIFGSFPAPFGALISPWCLRGDAGHFLAEHGKNVLITNRIKLWEGVINGVTYLHLHTPMIVHGDLKPGNVLIDDSGDPKICDFGLSRIFLDEPGSGLTTTTEHTGTERYLAPELVTSDTTVYPTAESDVYALGCLGLEFIYLQSPYSHRKNNLRGVIFGDLKKGIPPANDPPHSTSPFWPLIKATWNVSPELRPSAFAIARRSATIMANITVIQRIIEFTVDNDSLKALRPLWSLSSQRSAWSERNKVLITLSLVSRLWRSIAIAIKYREVRIYLDDSQTSQLLLIKTLETRMETVHSERRSYGSYTKHLSLVTKSYLNETDSREFSDSLRPIIQAMPALQSMIIITRDMKKMHDSNPFVDLPASESPVAYSALTSVKLSGLNAIFLQESLLTLQILPQLCRLYLISFNDLIPDYKDWLPDRISYLNLQYLVLDERSLQTAFLLPLCCAWNLPRLEHFHFIGCVDVSRALRMFMQAHGDILQHLIVEFGGRDPSGGHLSVLPLSDTLLMCLNLRSIIFPITEFPDIVNLSQRNTILETMTLVSHTTSTHPTQKQLETYRRRALMCYPKLVEWNFEAQRVAVTTSVSRSEQWFASFRSENDFIDIWDGLEHRRYMIGGNAGLLRSLREAAGSWLGGA